MNPIFPNEHIERENVVLAALINNFIIIAHISTQKICQKTYLINYSAECKPMAEQNMT